LCRNAIMGGRFFGAQAAHFLGFRMGGSAGAHRAAAGAKTRRCGFG
jgi:hypothetical protein